MSIMNEPTRIDETDDSELPELEVYETLIVAIGITIGAALWMILSMVNLLNIR